ncbi:HHR192Wp [Eremothecium sinecaudum]|uniref:HHR192Wp n=1 Tax=Eremothecium sinecaudum TaxID=45286 RepID=A0A0X8HWF3_9SACH|nr:HHR192Wp [Eremothecium sinecaudum]AMD22961.1 HHR192Wp [Eremothecium sinecaudum]
MVLGLSFSMKKSNGQIPDLSRYQQYYLDHPIDYSRSRLSSDAASTAASLLSDSSAGRRLRNESAKSLSMGRPSYLGYPQPRTYSLNNQKRATSLNSNVRRTAGSAAGPRSNSIIVKTTEVTDIQGRTRSVTKQTIRRINGVEYVETTTTTTLEDYEDEFEEFYGDFTNRNHGSGHPYYNYQGKPGLGAGVGYRIAEEDVKDETRGVKDEARGVKDAYSRKTNVKKTSPYTYRQKSTISKQRTIEPPSVPGRLQRNGIDHTQFKEPLSKSKPSKVSKKMSDQEMYLHALEAAKRKVYGDESIVNLEQPRTKKSTMSTRTLRVESELANIKSPSPIKEHKEKPSKKSENSYTFRNLASPFLNSHRKNNKINPSSADAEPAAKADAKLSMDNTSVNQKSKKSTANEESKSQHPFKFLAPVIRMKNSHKNKSVASKHSEDKSSPVSESKTVTDSSVDLKHQSTTVVEANHIDMVEDKQAEPKGTSTNVSPEEVTSEPVIADVQVEDNAEEDVNTKVHEEPAKAIEDPTKKPNVNQSADNKATDNDLPTDNTAQEQSVTEQVDANPDIETPSVSDEAVALKIEASEEDKRDASEEENTLQSVASAEHAETVTTTTNLKPEEYRSIANYDAYDIYSANDDAPSKHSESSSSEQSSLKEFTPTAATSHLDSPSVAKGRVAGPPPPPPYGFLSEKMEPSSPFPDTSSSEHLPGSPVFDYVPQSNEDDKTKQGADNQNAAENANHALKIYFKETEVQANSLKKNKIKARLQEPKISTVQNDSSVDKEENPPVATSNNICLKMPLRKPPIVPKALRSPPPRISIVHSDSDDATSSNDEEFMDVDEMYDKAVEIAMRRRQQENSKANVMEPKASTSPTESTSHSTSPEPHNLNRKMITNHSVTEIPPEQIYMTMPSPPDSHNTKEKLTFFEKLVKFTHENYGYQPRRPDSSPNRFYKQPLPYSAGDQRQQFKPDSSFSATIHRHHAGKKAIFSKFFKKAQS